MNLATHMLIDTLTDEIDAAVLISNDSDLSFPLSIVRSKVPVGTINPSSSYTAGNLRGDPADGVGGHWWRKLTAADFIENQLPDPAGHFRKPLVW